VTLPAATCRRLLNLPQFPTVWVGGVCAFVADDTEAYCGAWLDANSQSVRSMEVVEHPFSKQQLMRLLVQAMEHPHPKNSPCRPQTIIVNDLELQFFLRGILLPLEIEVQYSKDIPLLQEFFAFMESELIDEAEEQDVLPPEYAELFLPKVKAFAELDLCQHLCNMQPLKLYCESWESPTLVALFINRESDSMNREFGVMLYRGEKAFWDFWQRAMTAPAVAEEDDDDEYDDPSLLDQDCLLLNFEVADTVDALDHAFFQLKGQYYMFDVGVVHPLEGMRHFFAPEEAEMVYVVLDALIQFWQRHGKKFRRNAYPSIEMPLTISSPLHSALSYQVQVSTDPDLLEQMQQDMAAKEQELAPVEIKTIPADLYTLFQFETPESLTELRQAVSYYQPGTVPATVERYPILIIQTTKPQALAIAGALASEGGVHHLTLVSHGDRGSDSLVLLQTNANHFWMCQTLSSREVAELDEWFRAIAKGKGACGLAIAYGMSGKTLRHPTLKQMVGFYEVFLQPNHIDRDRPPTPQPIERRK